MFHGQETEYSYDGQKLNKVKFSENESLEIGYNENIPTSFSGEENPLETVIDYTDGLSFIQKSKLKGIGKEAEIGESEEVSRVTIKFTYGSDGKITYAETEDGKHKTTYEFDGQSYVTKCVEYENGFIVKAEKYSYVYNETTGILTATTAKSAPLSELYRNKLAEEAFDEGVVETTEYNELLQPKSKQWSARRISDTGNTETVRKEYVYDEDNRLTEVTTVREYSLGEAYTEKETYTYNPKGELVKTESYLVGAELSVGKQIEKREYDEQGKLTKHYTYNSLDGTSKYYLTDEQDETTGTSMAYGYDEFGNVTSVSGNTEEGEENSTQREYQYGLLTKLASGNEQAEYEYDEKSRVTKIVLNGNTYCEYTYSETSEEVTEKNANGEEFTMRKDSLDRLAKETYTQGLKEKKRVYEYDTTNRLTSVTESENEAEMRKQTFAYNTMDNVKWYKETENEETKITEKYAYDNFERLQEEILFSGKKLPKKKLPKRNA